MKFMKKNLIYYVLGFLFVTSLSACTQRESFLVVDDEVQEDASLSRVFIETIYPYFFSDIVRYCSPTTDRMEVESIVEEWITTRSTFWGIYNIARSKRWRINEISIGNTGLSPAFYKPKTMGGDMYFKSLEVLKKEFPEEFMHFAQDMIYPNGISSYTSSGKIDIEFEAKFICDISKLVDGWGGPYRGSGAKYTLQYQAWVVGVAFNSTGLLNYDDIMEGVLGITYSDFLRDFEAKKLYNGTVIDLFPELLYYYCY